MKIRNGIFILLVVGLALALFGEYMFFTSNLFKNEKGLQVTVQSKKETSELYTIDVEYPLFSSAKNLSENIEDFVEKSISDFKQASSENWQERKANATPDENLGEYPDQPFTLEMSWQPQQLNEQYISFVLRSESFTGGANPDDLITTYNYDMVNHKEVVLTDLFPDQKNYLETISNYARTTLGDQLNMGQNDNPNLEEMFTEGTKPEEKNFSKFTFNDQAITFYFPVYQLGPRDLGEQTLVYYRNSNQNTQIEVGIANPASKNCIDKGGTITMSKDVNGNEFGICVFEDNRQCEEWALYRSECPDGGVKITGYENQGQIDCAIRGGEVDIKNKMCTLPNKMDCAINEDGITCPDLDSPKAVE
ncbi:DUF333 domain-containing protein [Candidatus Beckwithbacteria bacterium]|nr:DUF333 domain-containing protein [Candidatus Beckwithbacteria bacterium]